MPRSGGESGRPCRPRDGESAFTPGSAGPERALAWAVTMQRGAEPGDGWGGDPPGSGRSAQVKPGAAAVLDPVPRTLAGSAAPGLPSTPLSPLQDEPIALDKQHSRDSAAITHSTYSLPASSYAQDPVYVNGGLNYSYRGYGALSSSLQSPASLQTGNHSNGEWGSRLCSLTRSQFICLAASGRPRAGEAEASERVTTVPSAELVLGLEGQETAPWARWRISLSLLSSSSAAHSALRHCHRLSLASVQGPHGHRLQPRPCQLGSSAPLLNAQRPRPGEWVTACWPGPGPPGSSGRPSSPGLGPWPDVRSDSVP